MPFLSSTLNKKGPGRKKYETSAKVLILLIGALLLVGFSGEWWWQVRRRLGSEALIRLLDRGASIKQSYALGEAYFECGQYDKALPLAEKGLEHAEGRLRGKFLYLLGKLQAARGEMLKAEASFFQAIFNHQKHGNLYGEALTYLSLARIPGREAFMDDAIQLGQAIESNEVLAHAYSDKAFVAETYEDALVLGLLALSFAQKTDDVLLSWWILRDVIRFQIEMDHLDNAEANLFHLERVRAHFNNKCIDAAYLRLVDQYEKKKRGEP